MFLWLCSSNIEKATDIFVEMKSIPFFMSLQVANIHDAKGG